MRLSLLPLTEKTLLNKPNPHTTPSLYSKGKPHLTLNVFLSDLHTADTNTHGTLVFPFPYMVL